MRAVLTGRIMQRVTAYDPARGLDVNDTSKLGRKVHGKGLRSFQCSAQCDSHHE